MEHVVGPQRNVATVCIGANDDMESCRAEVSKRVAEVDEGDGVVLLTDMFGGTPSNLATAHLGRNVEVIAGVNLPLLVKLAKVRGSEPLAEAVDHAQAAGRRYLGTAASLCAAAAPARGNGHG
jgi:PTS system mannose-specific IIA component